MTLGQLRPRIEYRFILHPRPGMTLDEVQRKYPELMIVADHSAAADCDCAQEILGRDSPHLVVARWEESRDQGWGCVLCFTAGKVVVVDSHDELWAHLDADHEGWNVDADGNPTGVEDAD